MQRTVQAIQKANSEGRLGLLLYSIPNFPNPTSYKESLSELIKLPIVSAIETTIPVSDKFSDHANPLIREAHKKATSFSQDWQSMIRELPEQKPFISVLYKESVEKIGFENIMKMSSQKLDAVLLEWNEPKEALYSVVAAKYGIGFIRCIGPGMDLKEIEIILETVPDQSLIYLMSAPMTGGELFSNEQLESVIKKAKGIRPNCKIAAGFGITTADDIRRLSKVPGMDAVIIGSEFLRHTQAGHDSVTVFLKSITGAMQYE